MSAYASVDSLAAGYPLLERSGTKISYKAMTGTSPSDVISAFGVSKVYVEARSS